MDSDLIRIEKLQSEEQWMVWKFQIKIVFNSSDLMEVVTGESPEPVKSASQKQEDFDKVYKSWKTLDNKAQKIIATTIGQQPMLHIMNCSTAHGMWSKLESIYEQKTQASIHLLQQRFYSFAMNSEDDMSVNISKLEKLVQQLKDLGEVISDSMIVTKILMTLPPSYNHFFSAWESTQKSERTLKNLTARLLMEESRIKQQQSVNEPSEALLAKKVFVKKGNTKNFHKEKRGKCFLCKQSGHYKVNCPKRREKEKGCYFNDKTNGASGAKGDAFITETEVFSAECTGKAENWYLDSGASDHMTFRKDWLINYEKFENPLVVRVGNGDTIYAYGRGDINILSFNNTSWIEKHLSNVLYVPKIKLNLFSSSAALDKGLQLFSDSQKCKLLKNDIIVAVGIRENKLFKLLFKVLSEQNVGAHSAIKESTSLDLWHQRLAHQNFFLVKKFLSKENIEYSNNDSTTCEACIFGKHHRSSFKKTHSRATKPGDLIHTDLCGPMQESSYGGSKYFLLFKDDYSNYRKVYFLKDKTEVCGLIEKYIHEAKKDLNHSITTIRSDNGLEYINKDVESLLLKHGICHQKSAPYTPEQNGRAERDMRTLVEAGRTMIHAKGLNIKLWAEAISTAVYVLNRTGNSPIEGKVPYELWFGKSPKVENLKVFGCTAYVHIPKQKRQKWNTKSKKGIFVGYCENMKAFRIWLPQEKKVEISCDVFFNEKETENKKVIVEVKKNEPENSKENLNLKEDNDEEIKKGDNSVILQHDNFKHSNESDEDDINNVYMTPKAVEIKEKSPPIRERLRSKKKITYSNLMLEGHAFVADCDEPVSYEEAVNSPLEKQWKKAMDEEIHSLNNNNTWKLVDVPEKRKILDNKWVFKLKKNVQGEVQRYKAKLVVRGFTQEYGLDYKETFSPVVKFTSIRAIFAIAAAENLRLKQFDVKTAFLYGNLDEEIFMRQPKGYDDSSGRVCKLQKSLYGLKQASRCWNKKFSDFLVRFKFKVSNADQCVFISHNGNKKVLLAIYVDDGFLAANDEEDINCVLNYLQREFEIKIFDAGLFLGLEITCYEDKGIHVRQTSYSKKILERFNMQNARIVSTPANSSVLVSEKEETYDTKFPFREAVGSLMYLAVATRPDIAYAVSAVSRYLDKPTSIHVNAVKRILKYIKGTMNHGIFFSNNCQLNLDCFSDADFGGDVETRRSTSGMVILCGTGAISWQSQRQKTVALSTTESEYISASEAVKELVWLKELMSQLMPQQQILTNLYVDNQSAMKLIKNPEYHRRTKHIDVRYHFIREKFEQKLFELIYVETNEQIADILTKPLPREKFCKLRTKMGIYELK